MLLFEKSHFVRIEYKDLYRSNIYVWYFKVDIIPCRLVLSLLRLLTEDLIGSDHFSARTVH